MISEVKRILVVTLFFEKKRQKLRVPIQRGSQVIFNFGQAVLIKVKT